MSHLTDAVCLTTRNFFVPRHARPLRVQGHPLLLLVLRWLQLRMSPRVPQPYVRLSNDARAAVAAAVTRDEARAVADTAAARSQTIASYTLALQLLNRYLQAFAPNSPQFAALSSADKHAASETSAALSKHLAMVHDRCRQLRNPHAAGNGDLKSRPSSAPSNDPLVAAIESEILDVSPNVQWDDISGLEDAKRALHEMLVLPAQRPDLYTGLRSPGKGVLLFGPPGTGKTLLAKAVATSCQTTFFSISASSLNSKFHGESERLVRALFQVARQRAPSFIFIDEVDAILGSRSDNEHEASRRLKNEFMLQFDGAMGSPEERVYVMAASNRPQDLDDAVRRRLDRRIYVPLPDAAGRRALFDQLTGADPNVKFKLSAQERQSIARRTKNYSGSDIKALCREASLMPLRELGPRISQIQLGEVRAVAMEDVEAALLCVSASASDEQNTELEKWNVQYGSGMKSSTKASSRASATRSQKPQSPQTSKQSFGGMLNPAMWGSSKAKK